MRARPNDPHYPVDAKPPKDRATRTTPPHLPSRKFPTTRLLPPFRSSALPGSPRRAFPPSRRQHPGLLPHGQSCPHHRHAPRSERFTLYIRARGRRLRPLAAHPSSPARPFVARPFPLRSHGRKTFLGGNALHRTESRPRAPGRARRTMALVERASAAPGPSRRSPRPDAMARPLHTGSVASMSYAWVRGWRAAGTHSRKHALRPSCSRGAIPLATWEYTRSESAPPEAGKTKKTRGLRAGRPRPHGSRHLGVIGKAMDAPVFLRRFFLAVFCKHRGAMAAILGMKTSPTSLVAKFSTMATGYKMTFRMGWKVFRPAHPEPSVHLTTPPDCKQ